MANKNQIKVGDKVKLTGMDKTFPIGARILVDGRDEATVAQVFPEGSSSFMFPHYKVHFVGGDRNVAVAMRRVGVEKRS